MITSTTLNSLYCQVISNSRKPNCVILDEIDGAPKPAIAMLVNMIKQGKLMIISRP